jgi:hypothetical protein
MQKAFSSSIERNRAPIFTTSRSPNLEVALSAAAAGVPVFPFSPSKRPLTQRGKGDATKDDAQIREWWDRWPQALAAIPTGETTGNVALDVDRGGEISFAALLARLGCDVAEDLSRVWSHTAGGGRHYFFQLESGTAPRTRASDIAPNIDSRGIGGAIIIPDNVLPDGRAYRWGGKARLRDAEPMPRELLYLMTFNSRERTLITETAILTEAIKEASPDRWDSILRTWRVDEAKRLAERCQPMDDEEGMRRQALHDLHAIAVEFASLTDGRRQRLFSLACRVARYVVHGKLSEIEFRGTLMDAARANGSLVKHGPVWAVSTIRNAINCAGKDPLPPLSRAFRSDRGQL